MHALIIEDEPILALDLAEALERLGFDTWDVAITERDAVARAEIHPPDLVIADIRLRVGNGIDAVRAIRRRAAVPVVFATANIREVKRELGRSVVLEKPFIESDLRRAVQRVCGPPEAFLAETVVPELAAD